MTQKIKEIAPIILNEIKKAKNILLHCHPSADPDSVGSALAMKFALEQLGKKVTIIQGDNEIPKAFAFPGVETIVKKNFFEIDINDFDLFIILDSGDIRMISGKDKIVFPESLMTIVIDHHASNKGYGKINCIDSKSPATCQVLFDIFQEWKVQINTNIAKNLFIGLYTDTGGFKYPGVTSHTFDIASKLVSYVPNLSELISNVYHSNTPGFIKFESLALESIEVFFDLLVVSFVSYDLIKNNNFHVDDIKTSEIASFLLTVPEWKVSCSIVEIELNKIKLSLRSYDGNKYDVSKLALALGGGGHKAAAGARLNMTIKEAIDKVVKTAKEIYNL